MISIYTLLEIVILRYLKEELSFTEAVSLEDVCGAVTKQLKSAPHSCLAIDMNSQYGTLGAFEKKILHVMDILKMEGYVDWVIIEQAAGEELLYRYRINRQGLETIRVQNPHYDVSRQ